MTLFGKELTKNKNFRTKITLLIYKNVSKEIFLAVINQDSQVNYEEVKKCSDLSLFYYSSIALDCTFQIIIHISFDCLKLHTKNLFVQKLNKSMYNSRSLQIQSREGGRAYLKLFKCNKHCSPVCHFHFSVLIFQCKLFS